LAHKNEENISSTKIQGPSSDNNQVLWHCCLCSHWGFKKIYRM